MSNPNIKPTHKPIKTYYAELKEYERLGEQNEGTVRAAFQGLLQHYCHQSNLTLLCEKMRALPPDKGVRGVQIDEFDQTAKSLIPSNYPTATGKQKTHGTTSTSKRAKNLPQATPQKTSLSNPRRTRSSISTERCNWIWILPNRGTSSAYFKAFSHIRKRTSPHGIPQSLNSETRCRNSVKS